jgi:hypothetical protein
MYDRRDLSEVRRDLAARLAKRRAKYPKLTRWIEENMKKRSPTGACQVCGVLPQTQRVASFPGEGVSSCLANLLGSTCKTFWRPSRTCWTKLEARATKRLKRNTGCACAFASGARVRRVAVRRGFIRLVGCGVRGWLIAHPQPTNRVPIIAVVGEPSGSADGCCPAPQAAGAAE